MVSWPFQIASLARGQNRANYDPPQTVAGMKAFDRGLQGLSFGMSHVAHNSFRTQPRLSKCDRAVAEGDTLSSDIARKIKYANQVALGTGRHSKHIYS